MPLYYTRDFYFPLYRWGIPVQQTEFQISRIIFGSNGPRGHLILWLTLCIKLLENWNASLRQHLREGFEDALGKIVSSTFRSAQNQRVFSESDLFWGKPWNQSEELWRGGTLPILPQNKTVNCSRGGTEKGNLRRFQLGGKLRDSPENSSKDHEFSTLLQESNLGNVEKLVQPFSEPKLFFVPSNLGHLDCE